MLDLLETGHFCLRETADQPFLGWDANSIRIATWAKFYDRAAQLDFYVFNMHFDHKGKIARTKSAKLLLQKIKEINFLHIPTFITGDFNALKGNGILKPIRDEHDNARSMAINSDSHKSFNAWGRWYLCRNIDYIFYDQGRAFSFKTIIGDYGVPYISDHYLIIAYFNY